MPIAAEDAAEIEAVRADRCETGRPTVPALEALLHRPLPVLDHGFVRVVDYMGDDAAVVQAARVSYGRGTRQVSEDKALIAYLMRHRHSTPFEMCAIKFHVKLPIFVARQWIRHRTASVNEISARYSILDKEFYIPEPDQLAAQSAVNRQGRGAVLEGEEAARVLALLREDAERAYAHYAAMLNEAEDGAAPDSAHSDSAHPDSAHSDSLRPDSSRQGLARELARMNLSLNFYTQWYWKTDLHNLMHFLSLRADAHAQYEIRVYAEAMLAVLDRWVPHTAEAFREYRLGAAQLSAKALAALRRMVAGESVTRDSSGLGKREWEELMALLHPEADS